MPKGYFKPFTPAQEQQIKEQYLHKPVKRLAGELGVTFGRIMRFLERNDLHLPKELVQQRILDSRKKPGDVPANKGKKQSEYMTPEGIAKTAKTRFKKGGKPPNCFEYEVGAIVLRFVYDKKYKHIKLSSGKWKLLHRMIWENLHGPIQEDQMLVFKDGDTTNCNIENLELICKIENMYRNSCKKYNREVIPSLVLTRKIENKLNTIKNG